MERSCRHNFRGSSWTLMAALLACLIGPVATRAAETAPKKPPLPKIVAISVQPASLTFLDRRDARSVIVTGRAASGILVDLSPIAKLQPASPIVRVDADSFIAPVKAGKTSLIVSAAGQRAVVPVTVKSAADPPISFVREVMPIFSKVGCNAGTCHGSAKGKNGFKLSLRGYDPDYDYHALIDDISGRRFNRSDPAQSLMLLKPTQGVAHQGGLVFEENSPFYHLLYRWIAEGVKSDTKTVARANRIEVLPHAPKLSLPDQQQQLVVVAHYPDGTTRDVTRDAVFTSTMPDTATVTPDGQVTAVRRGEAAVLVRYEGNYAADGLTVLGDRRGYQWAAQPQYNYIDKL